MSRMKIGKRLTGSFGVLLGVALTLAGSPVYWIEKLGHEFNDRVGITARKSR